MNRPYGQTVAPQNFPALPALQMIKFVEARVNGGMVTTIDPADIENNQLQKCKNARVRFDRTSRRPGIINIGFAKPDSNRVLGIKYHKAKSGANYTLRFTPSGIHILNADTWNPVTGVLTGTDKDRFRTVSVLDNFYFANNGADPIQKINFGTSTFAQSGNAPKYRYITGFYNRLVGAALRDTDETQVGWSADGDPSEWNPLNNETAGSSSIVESPSDLSDFVTGIFGLTNVMILLRERSVWLATKQPIPTNPFYFSTAFAGYGCDSPNSVALAPDGLIWFDRRTSTVWAFRPGAQPEPIGRPIENAIIKNIDDTKSIFASYNAIQNEYTLCIPAVASKYVLAWTFNFRTKAWSYDEFYDITSSDDTELSTGFVSIDSLAGTIDSLVGTIDDLSPSDSLQPNRIYGRGDGEALLEDELATKDDDHSDGTSGQFATELISKAFNLPEVDMYVAEIRIEYQAKKAGQFEIQYSKSGGAIDSNDETREGAWISAKTVSPTVLDRPQLLRYKKQIKSRRFAWRLYGTDGAFDILSFEVHVYPSGQSKK